MQEKLLWKGRPSQWVNLWIFLILGLLSFLLVPILIGLWTYLSTRMTRYELTTQNLRVTTGVLNTQTESLELYRVVDYSVLRPLSLRLFGLANVKLMTIDQTTPTVMLVGVGQPERLVNVIRTHVEAARASRGVREFV